MNLTLTFTIEEWRVIAAATQMGSSRLIGDGNRELATKLAKQIATETGKEVACDHVWDRTYMGSSCKKCGIFVDA